MKLVSKLLARGYWLVAIGFAAALLVPQTSDAAQFCCSCKNALGCNAGIPSVVDAADQSAADTACRTHCGSPECVDGAVAPGVCTAAGGGGTGAVVSFGSPLGPDIPTFIGRIIKAALGIVGTIALVMFIYGGFTWMVGGQRGEKKVQYAKDILVWSTLGMLVIFGAYILVNFIIKQVAE